MEKGKRLDFQRLDDRPMCMCVCACVHISILTALYRILLKNTQPDHQFIPLFLISNGAKDVSIHIHAVLETQREDTFTGYI